MLGGYRYERISLLFLRCVWTFSCVAWAAANHEKQRFSRDLCALALGSRDALVADLALTALLLARVDGHLAPDPTVIDRCIFDRRLAVRQSAIDRG